MTNERSEHQNPGARIKLSATVLEEFSAMTDKTVQEFTEEITQSHVQLCFLFSLLYFCRGLMCRAAEQEEFQEDLKEVITRLQEHHISKTKELARQSRLMMDQVEVFLDRLERQIIESANMRKGHESQLKRYGITFSSN